LRHVYSSRYQKFLEMLKQARLDANLSQVEVAARLEKPQSYVSKCESGERRVDIVELLAMHGYTGNQSGSLFRITNKQRPPLSARF
jgi:transcriptional regulator with XRE-family HTH domain